MIHPLRGIVSPNLSATDSAALRLDQGALSVVDVAALRLTRGGLSVDASAATCLSWHCSSQHKAIVTDTETLLPQRGARQPPPFPRIPVLPSRELEVQRFGETISVFKVFLMRRGRGTPSEYHRT